VAKDELIEVDLQLLLRGAAVGSRQPGLEVGEGTVGAGQDQLALLAAPALGDRLVVEAEASGNQAGRLVGESLLELHGRARGVWPSHKTVSHGI
jgi:hypothetical protein